MRKFITLLAISLSLAACKKESAQLRGGPTCFVCSDTRGAEVQVVCGDDEQNAFENFSSAGNCWEGKCPPTRAQFNAACRLR